MTNEEEGTRCQKIYNISASATIWIKQTLGPRAKNPVVESRPLSKIKAIHPSGFIMPQRNKKGSSERAQPVLLQWPGNQNSPSIDDLNLPDSDD